MITNAKHLHIELDFDRLLKSGFSPELLTCYTAPLLAMARLAATDTGIADASIGESLSGGFSYEDEEYDVYTIAISVDAAWVCVDVLIDVDEVMRRYLMNEWFLQVGTLLVADTFDVPVDQARLESGREADDDMCVTATDDTGDILWRAASVRTDIRSLARALRTR